MNFVSMFMKKILLGRKSYWLILIYSIAEYTVNNSVIKPTYMLTYESASDLLYLNLEEEAELKILDEAATLRFRWRREQVAYLIKYTLFLSLLAIFLKLRHFDSILQNFQLCYK